MMHAATASSSGSSFFAWFRKEASAKREWLVTTRKGPWEGERREFERRLARFFLLAFLCGPVFIERETSGYKADAATS